MLIEDEKNVYNGHRGRLDIIADILEASFNETRKTYFMCRCNLSFRQLKSYLGFLLKNGFICSINNGCNSNNGMFKITDKGKEFLKAYKNLKALMK